MKREELQHVHFVGVGGIGMSNLARLCLADGKRVSGSDVQSSSLSEALAAEGVQVTYGQDGTNLPEAVDLMVYSEAVPKDNPERKALEASAKQSMNYFDALGYFLNDYYLIAVAGSHGKSTTTAMLADIFETAERDPTVVIGTLRKKTSSNFRGGKSKYAIVEACEFKRDFLSLEPNVLVITNIEYEHVDYYKNLKDVQDAFAELAAKVPEDGVIVTNTDDPHIAEALRDVTVKTVDFSQFIDPLFELPVPGLHNQMNAAAAIAVAQHEGIDVYLARQALKEFAGTWRRFEVKGKLNGAIVIDDYAHHPTEIRATIKATRDVYPDKRIVAVFQPHTHTRLRALYEEFKTALAKADYVYLLPVYAARDEGVKPVDVARMVQEMDPGGTKVQYVETAEAVAEHLRASVAAEDVVLIMGAGDVTQLASELVTKI